MEVLGKNTEMMSIYHGSLKKKERETLLKSTQVQVSRVEMLKCFCKNRTFRLLA